MAAMGGTGGNRANMATYDKSSITLGHTNDLYLSGSAGYNVLAIASTNIGNVGLAAQRYDFDDFTEVGISAIYARSFGKRFLTAFILTHQQHSILEYDKNSTSTLGVAAQYYLNSEWLIGFQIDPVNFIADMSYSFDKQVLLTVESEFDWQYGADFRMGIEYAVVHWIWLRGGVSVNHFRQFAGIGLSHQKFGIDLASAYHPKLGYSSHISLNYAF